MTRIFKHSYCRIVIIAIAMFVAVPTSIAQKMKPEDVVAKSLDAIGQQETRASIHNRIAAGKVVATFTSPGTAKFEGQCVMASEGDKNMLAMGFEGPGTFQEKVSFDGGKVNVASPRPGSHGFWGDFLLTHDNIVKLGLVGGVLSDSWPLLNLTDKKGSLEYRGIKKIDGKSLHELEYVPRGMSDLKIALFFDAETFQHVRTEYTRVISAGLGGASVTATGRVSGAVDASGQQRPTRYKMVEQFGDFKKEGGLMLPHDYKLGLEMDTRAGTFVGGWDLTLTDFAFNQPFPPGTFKVN